MKVIERDIVSALIISKDEKLFQGRKDPAKGGVYVDCWHLPGGGVESGEDKLKAVRREVKEETGINIDNYQLDLIDEVGEGEAEKIDQQTGQPYLCKMNFSVFVVRLNDQVADDIKVSLDDDLVAYQWNPLSQLADIEMTPPSVALFKRLGYLK